MRMPRRTRTLGGLPKQRRYYYLLLDYTRHQHDTTMIPHLPQQKSFDRCQALLLRLSLLDYCWSLFFFVLCLITNNGAVAARDGSKAAPVMGGRPNKDDRRRRNDDPSLRWRRHKGGRSLLLEVVNKGRLRRLRRRRWRHHAGGGAQSWPTSGRGGGLPGGRSGAESSHDGVQVAAGAGDQVHEILALG